MKSFGKRPTDSKLYILGLILAIPIALLFFLQNSGTVNFDVTDLTSPCLFHRVSGLYCPGCGGTRAVKALLEGRPAACFFYHPFVLYCAVIYILLWQATRLNLYCKKNPPTKNLL